MADAGKIADSARAFYEGMFNRHDPAAALEHLADDFVDHVIPPGMDNSRQGFIDYVGMFLAAFPDLSVDIDDVIVSGDRFAVRSTWTGTHDGPLPMPDGTSIPATGKTARWEGIDIGRVDEDARALEHWGIFDQMAMMGSLGLLPPPG